MPRAGHIGTGLPLQLPRRRRDPLPTLVILVLRSGESLLWNDPRAEPLRPNDRLVEITAVPGPAQADQPAPRT